MFSFLNPRLLWALPLASAPILLHLLFLRRARRVPFSDLTLLRAAYLRSLPSSRLRQWLLIAARCLILASLILGFARPLLHSAAAGPGGAGEEEAVHAVMLVDASYSMGYQLRGKTRLELAKGYGESLLRLLKPQDRVAVAAFSDRLEAAPQGRLEWAADRERARADLRRISAGARPTDYLPALREAYRFLKGSPAKRRVVILLSDNAAHGWRSDGASRLAESVPDYDPSVTLTALDWPDEPDNAAVLGAQSAQAAADRSELEARVGLRGSARRDWELALWQQGRRADQKLLRLDGGEQSTSFRLRPVEGASSWGRLELRRDALPADDAFYYSFWTQSRPKVLIVHGGPRSLEVGRGGYFLKKLFLDPQGSLLPYAVELADSVRAQSLRLGDYGAVMLLDFRRIPPELGAALDRYVRAGGGLWLIAAKTDGPEAYRPISRLLPARIGEPLELPAAGTGLRPDAAQLPPESAPRFSWRDFELQKVAVRHALSLEPAAGAKTWLRDASGRPLWVWGRWGDGRVLVWGSALDFTWTDLAVKPVFAAWVDFGLGRLTGFLNRKEWRTVKVGSPIVRSWGPEEPAPASVVVRSPGGQAVRLRVVNRRAEYVPESPGIYFLEGASPPGARSAPGGEEAYAANLDRDTGEWDLRPGLKASFRMLRPDALQEDFTRALYGREVRVALWAFLLGLLALETWLANPDIPMPGPPAATRPAAKAGIAAAAALLWAVWPAGPAAAQQGDKFVWTQLRYDGAWDPYPGVDSDILRFVGGVTSILAVPERRVLALKDPRLFESPFAVLAGRSAPPGLDDEELGRLRSYLTSGGFLWLEDSSGLRTSPFDRWARQTLKLVFPDSDLTPLGAEHVIHKTFFLMRAIGGRVLLSGSLEGIDWGGRTVVVYSRNDIFGAWAKDALGHYLYECVPGGEAQRINARKLALNIVMYSLTGSYKTDAVHQPFLLQKMRLGLPP